VDPLNTFREFLRRPSPRIAIKVKGRIHLINSGDVVAVLAEGNYVLFQQESRSYLLRETISVVAAKLEPFGVVRIHRSVIVNRAFVEVITPRLTGEYGLRVKGGKEYSVTRTYKENLKSLTEFWIGSGAFFSAPEQWRPGPSLECVLATCSQSCATTPARGIGSEEFLASYPKMNRRKS
jgi:hypothetical protein